MFSGCSFFYENRRIFTDGDLRRSLQKYKAQVMDIPMSLLMTSKVQTIGPEEMAWDALKLMESSLNQRLTVLPLQMQKKK